MKNILLITLLALMSATLFGQTTVVKSLGNSNTNAFYYGKSSDTIGVGQTSIYKNVYKATDSKINCHATVWLDSIGGTAEDVSISLFGKTSDFETFDSITSKTWSGSSSDTLLEIEGASSYYYRFWQIKVYSATGGFNAAIDTLEFNFFKN